MQPMQLSPSIFKAYDIRGIVPSTLTEDVAERWAARSAPRPRRRRENGRRRP
jgi:phosphomannomutase